MLNWFLPLNAQLRLTQLLTTAPCTHVAPFTALDLHSGKTISAEQSQLVQTDELESPTVQAAHKLLEDLCAIATGVKWHRCLPNCKVSMQSP